MRMTDPTDALKSFQAAFSQNKIAVQPCSTDKNLFVSLDNPNNTPRFTYVRLENKIVTALVLFVLTEPLKGIPCFQIGYAVPELYRGKRLAKGAISAAMRELANGFSNTPMTEFYVEAVVGNDNEASKGIASALISGTPIEITDAQSKLPALQFLRKIEAIRR